LRTREQLEAADVTIKPFQRLIGFIGLQCAAGTHGKEFIVD
jgi:hypothetical protein